MIRHEELRGVDGLRLLETLRSQGNATPVMFLSALAQVDERVKGLKAGGDDYMTKPFSFAELLARVEALTRRGRGDGPATKLVVLLNTPGSQLARVLKAKSEQAAA